MKTFRLDAKLAEFEIVTSTLAVLHTVPGLAGSLLRLCNEGLLLILTWEIAQGPFTIS
jgi:hypothetical protein